MLRVTDYLCVLTYVFILFLLYRMTVTWFSSLVEYHFEMRYRQSERRPDYLPMLVSLLPIILSVLNPKENHAEENSEQGEVISEEGGSPGT